jgi:hypothetical protein
MKKTVVACSVLLGATGLFAVYHAPFSSARCVSEDHAVVANQTGDISARYENMICGATSGTLESRVLVQKKGSSSWHLVFSATSAVDSALDRRTKASKLKLAWLDREALAIEPSSGLVVASGIANELVKVVIADQNKADGKSATGAYVDPTAPACTHESIIARLESRSLMQGRDAIVACLYDRASAAETWQIVDAIWLNDKKALPTLNWEQLQFPEMRLPMASLWTVLAHRHNIAANFEAPRAYVLKALESTNIAIRYEATSALGNVGTPADIERRAKIAQKEPGIATAKRALSAIASIEMRVMLRPSRIDEFASTNARSELREHAAQLKALMERNERQHAGR